MWMERRRGHGRTCSSAGVKELRVEHWMAKTVLPFVPAEGLMDARLLLVSTMPMQGVGCSQKKQSTAGWGQVAARNAKSGLCLPQPSPLQCFITRLTLHGVRLLHRPVWQHKHQVQQPAPTLGRQHRHRRFTLHRSHRQVGLPVPKLPSQLRRSCLCSGSCCRQLCLWHRQLGGALAWDGIPLVATGHRGQARPRGRRECCLHYGSRKPQCIATILINVQS